MSENGLVRDEVNIEIKSVADREDLQKWDESIGQFLKKIESDFDL